MLNRCHSGTPGWAPGSFVSGSGDIRTYSLAHHVFHPCPVGTQQLQNTESRAFAGMRLPVLCSESRVAPAGRPSPREAENFCKRAGSQVNKGYCLQSPPEWWPAGGLYQRRASSGRNVQPTQNQRLNGKPRAHCHSRLVKAGPASSAARALPSLPDVQKEEDSGNSLPGLKQI